MNECWTAAYEDNFNFHLDVDLKGVNKNENMPGNAKVIVVVKGAI